MESRIRKRLLLMAGSIAFLACGLWLLLPGKAVPEPTYNGRKLSEWMADLGSQRAVHGYDVQKDAHAREAIHAIGTNALPWLLQWISYEPQGFTLKLIELSEKLPYSIRQVLPIVNQHQKSSYNRFRADNTLYILGPDAAPAIPVLATLVSSPDRPLTRDFALRALAYIGPDAMPTILGLVSNFNQPSDIWMLYPLMNLKVDEIKLIHPLLLPHLQNTSLSVATNVIEFFSNSFSHSPTEDNTAFLTAFLKCLEDSRPQVRAMAAWELGRLDVDARPALPALLRALYDSDAKVRKSAAFAIPNIDSKTREPLPALLDTLGDLDPDVRMYGAKALGQFQEGGAFAEAEQNPTPQSVVSALSRALGDPQSLVRMEAAEALGKFGKEAVIALPALNTLLTDANVNVRVNAVAAIRRIDPGVLPEELRTPAFPH